MFYYVFLFFSFYFLSMDFTFAENSDLWKLIVQFVQIILNVVSVFIWVLTSLVSILLYPGWVNWEIINLWPYLKKIWIMVSNIVYFLFAFILIWIAFMNIIWWKAAEKYEIKQALPKFIIWVLIVPISWYFVQFVISVSSYLTVQVLSVPYSTFQSYDLFKNVEWTKAGKKEICLNYEIDIYWSVTKQEAWNEAGVWTTINNYSNWFLNCVTGEGSKTATISEILNWKASTWVDGMKNSIFWLISIYTYWVMDISSLDKLTIKELTTADAIKHLLNLSVKVILDLVFIVVYFILMVALFLALFTRWVWLWLYSMLSPVFWLMYFFDKWAEGVSAWENKFSIKELISLAMVPVLVSAALSFWLLFLLIVWQWLSEQDAVWDGKNPIEIGWFSISFKSPDKDTPTPWSILWNIQWTLWQIVLQMFWLAILWIAVMSALNSSSVTKAVVEPISQFGKSVWSLIAKSPQYAPIIPTWKWTERMWISGLSRFSSELKSTIDAKMTKPWSDFASRITWWWSEVANVNSATESYLKGKFDISDSTAGFLRKTLSESKGDWENLFLSDKFKSWLAEFAKTHDFKTKDLDIMNNRTNFTNMMDELSQKFPDNYDIWMWDDRRKLDLGGDIRRLTEALKTPYNNNSNTTNGSIPQPIVNWNKWNYTINWWEVIIEQSNDDYSKKIVHWWENVISDWTSTSSLLTQLKWLWINTWDEISQSLQNIKSGSSWHLFYNETSKQFSTTKKESYIEVEDISYDDDSWEIKVKVKV